MLWEEALLFRLKRASRWRISLFVDSIGNVRSLPKKCLISGKSLKKPPHSSVTKSHFPSSTWLISGWRLASLRSPKTHAIPHQWLARSIRCFFPFTKCQSSSIWTISACCLGKMIVSEKWRIHFITAVALTLKSLPISNMDTPQWAYRTIASDLMAGWVPLWCP